ncbi:MAG: folylpolyglutamate synthase/dihydrofolate synthase family protein [Flavobacteriales bacterium]|nr:folylpolyglutamate synthase/dihydrofolate synthase family protein [Flavobacteriales bacterium]
MAESSVDSTYNSVLEFLYTQLPMFHRVGPAAYKPGLDNTCKLLEIVGNPECGLRCVHIAGTNGKGSTSHLMASVMQEAGYKTGLYTSPHLKDFRERIRINGVMMPKEVLIEFVDAFKTKWKVIQPSFFEITVALAFWYFKKEGTEIAIIETGLGGRLDSTNVIDPELSVITRIGMDHMNLLGNTLEKIAFEKAGIIKANRPVVLGIMPAEALQICLLRASQLNVHCSVVDEKVELLESPLIGIYQQENHRTAFKSLEILRSLGWDLDKEIIQTGFRKVIENTGFMGRWQVLSESPMIVLDVAHNEDGIKAVLRQVMHSHFQQLHIVLAMVSDKDINHILGLFPKNATYYFCKANIPRGMDAYQLAQLAAMQELNGAIYPSVREAFDAASEAVTGRDFLLVTGSFFTVAEVL